MLADKYEYDRAANCSSYKNDVGPLGARAPRRFDSNSRAAADHDDRLPTQFLRAAHGDPGHIEAHHRGRNLLDDRVDRRTPVDGFSWYDSAVDTFV